MVPLKPVSRVPRIRVLAGGHLLIGFTILLGVIAAQAAANALHALVALLLAFQLVSGFRSFLGLRGLGLEVDVPLHLDVGGEASLVVRVRNGKRRLAAHSVEVAVRCEEGGAPDRGARVDLARAGRSLGGGAPRPARCRAGVARLAEITVSSAWPCELFRRTLRFPSQVEVLVRPRRVRFDPPERAGPTGPVRARRLRVVGEGDLRGLRPFRDGDSPRAIHWRTSARLGEPIVREDAGSGPLPWIASLAPDADDPIDVERSLERASALARVALASGRTLEVRVAGEERPRIVARRSELEALLDALVRFVPGGTVPGGAAPRARAFLLGRDARPPAGATRVETAPFPLRGREPAPRAGAIRVVRPASDRRGRAVTFRRRSPSRRGRASRGARRQRAGARGPRRVRAARPGAPHAAHRRRPSGSAPAIP